MNTTVKRLVVLGGLLLGLTLNAVPALADAVGPGANGAAGNAPAGVTDRCASCHGLGMTLPPAIAARPH